MQQVRRSRKRQKIALVSLLCLSACGEDGARLPFTRRAQVQAPLAQGGASQATMDTRFDGQLVQQPFVPRSAIWGIESRSPVRRKGQEAYRTRDLMVMLSTSDDPCADWPRIIGQEGHMGLFLRMSKLVRHAGSAVFVEPDEGTYHVEQPHGSVPVVSRGAEVMFRATSNERGDIDAWIAHTGDVELTERSSTSDIVRGTFANEMVPFALDDDPQGPIRAISGAFTAKRCEKMDESN